MRWLVPGVTAAVLVCGSMAMGQDQPNADELRRMYDASQQQLKAAQDRKNELAAENDRLQIRLAELQKQLDTAHAAEARFSERTYQLRSTFAAWERFLERYPVLKGRWQAYLEADLLSVRSLPEWVDLDPLRLPSPSPVTQPTTAPATQPATQPQ